MSKSKIINEAIKEISAKNYLEIGYGNGSNFNLIDLKNKLAIDPEAADGSVCIKSSSDDFFATNKEKFDVIFIDGDHHSEQVEKDIVNAWNCLTKKGVIILHDVKPFTKEMQEVPRIQDQWTGDAWRAYEGFKKVYPRVKTKDIAEKYGLGFIFKSKSKIELGFIDKETTYEEFSKK